MHAVVQPLVSWLFSHSLIDAGQRSEKSSHAALSSGITSPTSRSESSFGCVRLNSGASQEPERSPPSLPTWATEATEATDGTWRTEGT